MTLNIKLPSSLVINLGEAMRITVSPPRRVCYLAIFMRGPSPQREGEPKTKSKRQRLSTYHSHNLVVGLDKTTKTACFHSKIRVGI